MLDWGPPPSRPAVMAPLLSLVRAIVPLGIYTSTGMERICSGARGDGVHDDTAALQQCLNDAGGATTVPPLARTVRIPAGCYNVSELEVTAGLSLALSPGGKLRPPLRDGEAEFCVRSAHRRMLRPHSYAQRGSRACSA